MAEHAAHGEFPMAGNPHDPSIADVTARRAETPLKITSRQRLYYSYRFDDISRETELANVGKSYAPQQPASKRTTLEHRNQGAPSG